MKNTLLTIFFAFTIFSHGYPQEESFQVEKAFDFWIGEWTVSWQGKDLKRVAGTNKVAKILDGNVIQEHFENPSNGFKGTSISVYSPQTNTWHQAWADNQGGYFDFVGEVTEKERIFIMPEENENGLKYRMIFEDITTDSFIWKWQSKKKEDDDWSTLWQIDYVRQ